MSSDRLQVPNHIGLIMDGNRRWAKQKGLATLEGHLQGYETLKEITKVAIDRGVRYVSAFAFSTENWNRTEKEVKYLMGMAYRMMTRDIKDLDKENIRVVWLGSPERVSDRLLKAIKKAEETTKNNTRGTLAICFNYGAQQEIVDAARKLIEVNTKAEDVTKETFEAALYAPEVPQIDLLIRTSGEQRLSNFMLWRLAYAELHFINKHWPDFSTEDLDEALTTYQKRERRLGGNTPSASA